MTSAFDGLVKRQPRTTIADEVYEDIRRLLMTGAIPPGEKITLRGLAALTGTSPMPVRDAVRRLVTEGAFDLMPSRGLRVHKPSLFEFREVVKIRLALEGLATEEAVAHLTAKDIDRIAALVARYEAVGKAEPLDPVQVIDANRRLHFALYEASRMPVLVNMIETIWLKVSPIFSLSMSSKDRRADAWESFDHHRRLLVALERRDAAMARLAVVSDIQDAACYIEGSEKLA
ncbi:GntR family transcriptional regulator [uncultured Paracoccus sp.]|uniref:GntR family transcriptional regulator n=1 Tax=uncultured Paracoccus sp. TaxID=189685 RepID=UPI0026314E64|nr:GntR family transcriptional regulator [uncultured Paracoccus sp.]